jgi:hypothetical protein
VDQHFFRTTGSESHLKLTADIQQLAAAAGFLIPSRASDHAKNASKRGQVLKPSWYFSLLLVVGGLLFFSFPGA